MCEKADRFRAAPVIEAIGDKVRCLQVTIQSAVRAATLNEINYSKDNFMDRYQGKLKLRNNSTSISDSQKVFQYNGSEVPLVACAGPF